VLDEARSGNRAVASFPAADEDYFAEMDGGGKLSPEEVKGRNTWIVWTDGNDLFWDDLSTRSFGTLDFPKTLSSQPSLKFSRDNRWHYLDLVNEPCFGKATSASPAKITSLIRSRMELVGTEYPRLDGRPREPLSTQKENMPST
jgi:hypothetical protein